MFKFLQQQQGKAPRGRERESELQKQVFDWLKARGIFAWRMPIGPVMRGKPGQAVYSKSPIKGFPDIAGVLQKRYRGRLFVLELKVEKREMTPEQVAWMVDLQAAGAAGALIRSLEDLERVMRLWGEIL